MKSLHALFALGARHGVGKSGNDGEMQLLAFWTIENDTVFIDQREVAAIAQKSDGSALGNVDANAVGQNALHAGGLYPGDLLHFAAASVERNAQHAVATAFVKRSKHCS